MTEEEQQRYIKFQSQVRMYLKTLSKKKLIGTCVALIVDNHGLKSALEELQKGKNEKSPV